MYTALQGHFVISAVPLIGLGMHNLKLTYTTRYLKWVLFKNNTIVRTCPFLKSSTKLLFDQLKYFLFRDAFVKFEKSVVLFLWIVFVYTFSVTDLVKLSLVLCLWNLDCLVCIVNFWIVEKSASGVVPIQILLSGCYPSYHKKPPTCPLYVISLSFEWEKIAEREDIVERGQFTQLNFKPCFLTLIRI